MILRDELLCAVLHNEPDAERRLADQGDDSLVEEAHHLLRVDRQLAALLGPPVEDVERAVGAVCAHIARAPHATARIMLAVSAKTQQRTTPHQRRQTRRALLQPGRRLPWVLAASACAAAAVAIVVLLLGRSTQVTPNDQPHSTPTIARVPSPDALPGQRLTTNDTPRTLRLPGATMTLGSSTTVTIGSTSIPHLLEAGTITLTVEPHSPQAPFRINSGHCLAEVLGTEFSLRRAEYFTQVDVQSGRVAIDAAKRHRTTVGAGQHYRCWGELPSAWNESFPAAPPRLLRGSWDAEQGGVLRGEHRIEPDGLHRWDVEWTTQDRTAMVVGDGRLEIDLQLRTAVKVQLWLRLHDAQGSFVTNLLIKDAPPASEALQTRTYDLRGGEHLNYPQDALAGERPLHVNGICVTAYSFRDPGLAVQALRMVPPP